MAKLGRLSQWALNFSDANWSKINQNLSGFALNDLEMSSHLQKSCEIALIR